MKIVWSEYAQTQRLKLLIARADYAGISSARKADAEIRRLLDLAATQPGMGRPGIFVNTRELYPLRYRLVYTVNETGSVLSVVALLPQWQRWPLEE